ncbi:hypothetical protein DSO57_1001274 [Entomophthora muscae]|uniref:Uncharacterized protein n=1 Tax=Entomophthora muscae TaxID=34485 RepID=A0ACC2T8X4_9FUNG|nr:hypothetical protein DSO57_1001274 [Entomophthora muscae]
MTIRSAYIIFLVTSITSYSLFLFSVFTPNWVELTFSTVDKNLIKSYGLFFVCTSIARPSNIANFEIRSFLASTGASHLVESPAGKLASIFKLHSSSLDYGENICLRFPEPRSPLCQNFVGLYEVWSVATSFSIFTLFAGAWLLYGLLEIVTGGSSHRSRGWAFLSIYVALYSIGKLFVLIIINSIATDLMVPTQPGNISSLAMSLGTSFNLALISFSSDVINSIFLALTHRTLRPLFQAN